MEGLHALGLHGDALNQVMKTKIAKTEGDYALDIRDNGVLVSTLPLATMHSSTITGFCNHKSKWLMQEYL